MRTTNNPPEPLNRQLLFHIRAQREVTKFQHSSAGYSDELLALVEDCLRYRPRRRPGAKRLLRRVKRRMRNHLGGFDTYGVNGRIPWNKPERLKGNLKDFWSFGQEVEVRQDRV